MRKCNAPAKLRHQVNCLHLSLQRFVQPCLPQLHCVTDAMRPKPAHLAHRIHRRLLQLLALIGAARLHKLCETCMLRAVGTLLTAQLTFF